MQSGTKALGCRHGGTAATPARSAIETVGDRMTHPDEGDAAGEHLVRVTGTVRGTDGVLIAGVPVSVGLRDLAGDSTLEEVQTDAAGNFSFLVDRQQLLADGVQRAVVVQARGERVGVVDETMFIDPGATIETDLVVPPDLGTARVSAAREAIAGQLGDRALQDLDRQQLAFVAATTQQDPVLITRLAQAEGVAAQIGIDRDLAFGLLDAGLPADGPALLASDDEVILAALDQVGQTNAVSQLPTGQEAIKVLRGARSRFALQPATDATISPLSELLSARLGGPEQEQFIALALEHSGEPTTFWDEAKSTLSLSDGAITDLQDRLQVASIVGADPALLTTLTERLGQDERLRPLDLAVVDEHGLANALEGAAIPAWVPDDGDDAARRLRWAAGLSFRAEQDFPLATLIARVDQSNISERPELLASLRELSDAQLAEPIGIDAAPSAINDLKRVHALAGRATDSVALLGAGLTSARTITMSTREAFVADFDHVLIGSAGALHDRASRLSAQVAGVISRYHDAFQTPLAALPEPKASTVLPAWKDLFGSLDLCACSECRSVDGPAAYLVDVLAMLRAAPGGMPGTNALTQISERRPDLLDLELSCRNTNTTVPYVDLVCEVLEGAVAPAGQPTAKPIASERTAPELLAAPERVNDAAYAELAAAPFPWTLPFDRSWTTARTFLEHLGLPRHELMRRYAHAGTPDAVTIAAEELGLSPGDRDHLSAGAPAEPWALWGLPLPVDGDWFTAFVTEVGLFLDHAALTFEELETVLASEVLNPGGAVALQAADGTDHACKIADYRLTGLTDEFLERVRRFERLRRPTGLAITELHALLSALAPAPAAIETGPLLDQLAAALRLRSLGLDVEILASLWATVPTRSPQRGAPSLWERVFDTPAVRAAASGATAFSVDAAGTALAATGDLLIDHAPAIQAALSIRAEEFADLVAAGDTQPAPFTIAQLSRLHRHVTLARALGLSVRGLLDLRRLWAGDPFASPSATEAFVRAAATLDGAGLTPDALGLVLGARPERPLERDTRLARQEPFVASLRTAVATALAGAAPVADPGAAALTLRLAGALPPADATAVLAIVRGTDGQSDDDRRATLGAALGDLLDATRVSGHLVGPTSPTDPDERAAYLLGQFAARDLAQVYVVQQLAALSGLDPATTERLASELSAGTDEPLPQTLLSPAFLAGTGPASPAVVGALTQLERAAALLRGHAVSAEMLVVLLERAGAGAAGAGWLSLTSLPSTADPAGAPARFAAWLELERLLDVVRGAGHGEPVVRALDAALGFSGDDAAATTARAAILDTLAEVPGWGRTDLEEAAGPAGLDLTFPDDFRTPLGLERLASVLDASARLGVSPATPGAATDSWIAGSVSPGAADAIRHAAAARHEPGDWPAVARPLQDRLRIGARDALVALLCHRQGREPSDLFGHYLIDVEMDPCQLTSRVKQAISSCQLLVQRGLLNLEPGVKLTGAQARNWRTWMRSYRIWQANRKVFLYPENWIEPSLRDDKTPLFKELEDALQQGEITDEAAETAFLAYADGLHELGGLEMIGSHVQHSAGPDQDQTVLHLFGRTRGKPHRLYYRTCTDWKSWSPWELVPVEVTADQVAPVVFNRRLYLYWLIPERKATKKPPKDQNSRTPDYYWEMTLAWSERRNGQWGSKRLSTSKLITDFPAESTESTGIEFGLTIDTANQWGGVLRVGNETMFGAFLGGIGSAQIKREPIDPAIYIHCVAEFEAFVPGEVTLLNRNVLWVGRWKLGSGEDDPQVTWAQRAYGPPSPKLPPYKWPRLSTRYRSGQFRPTANGDPIRIYTELSVTAAASNTKEVQLLDRSTLGAHVRLHAEYDQVPTTDSFLFADLSRSYLVRGVWQFRPQVLESQGGSVRVGQATLDLSIHRYIEQATVEVKPPWEADLSKEALKRPLEEPGWIQDRLAVGRGPVVVNGGVIGGGSPAVRQAPQVALDGHSYLDLVDFQRPPDPGVAITNDRLSRDRSIIDMVIDEPGARIEPAAVVFPRFWTYEFTALHHPWTASFVKALSRGGVPELLSLETQYPRLTGGFEARYRPTGDVATPYPSEDLEFGARGVAGAAAPFGVYDWEMFFHAPVLLASLLSDHQRHEDAQRWFHYVFDPTRGPVTDPRGGATVTDWRRAWGFRPFFEEADEQRSVAFLEALLHKPTSDKALLAEKARFLEAVDAWRADPFKPHLVARFRPGAYQRNVVARYIKNLLDWGDQLFAKDTIESINEATQLYVMASELLGERPVDLPPAADDQHKSFRDLEPTLDAFSGALVSIEGALATGDAATTAAGVAPPGSSPDVAAVESLIGSLYFCVPRNAELLALWDTVADRLYKVRHCMNLQGVTRQLPLFEPPIDPALLVRAAAAGLSLDSVVTGLGGALPNYRFGVMAAKAGELCAEVRALGSALLGALERRDAEELAQLRATQERTLLDAVRRVRVKQIEEAEQAIKTLEVARKNAEERQGYFSTREKSSTSEIVAHDALIVQGALRAAQGIAKLLAGALHGVPNFTVGAAGWTGSPVATVTMGGSAAAGVAGGIADGIGVLAEIAGIVSTQASYNAANDRRWDDWQHQLRLAVADLAHADQQALAAELRLAIAEHELENHDLQAEHAAANQEFLRTKFTNKALFDWMVGQVSALYFQAYGLALAAARQAERCYQYELASDDAFIAPDSWDSLRRGLLAGDRLQRDLKRMESEYLATNAREHELTKHVSLSLRDPLALERLRTTGTCELSLPEWLFDLDHPGHYLRRIKTVSLTLPAVVGPYTNVNARLTLLRSEQRVSAELAAGKYVVTDPDTDRRVRPVPGPAQVIATSRGQSDSGLFELSLKDERYLPFEGAGAVSTWKIELDPRTNDFDLATLADVILELRYTARDGGDRLRNACIDEVVTARPTKAVGPLVRGFSARTELSDAWHAFLYPPGAQDGQVLELDLDLARFPFRARQGNVDVTNLRLALLLDPRWKRQFPAQGLAARITDPGGAAVPAPAGGLALKPGNDPALDGLPGVHMPLTPAAKPGRWRVEVPQAAIDALPPELLQPTVAGAPKRLSPEAFADLLIFQTYVMRA